MALFARTTQEPLRHPVSRARVGAIAATFTLLWVQPTVDLSKYFLGKWSAYFPSSRQSIGDYDARS